MAVREATTARRGDDGAVALVGALMMITVFGFAALVVDIGSLYFTRRSLQYATDAAALAATYGLNASPLATTTVFANNYLGYNGFPASRLAGTPTVTTGRYCPDAGTSPPTPSSRFTATVSASAVCASDPTGIMYGAGPNAVQVTASVVAPLYFAGVLVPGSTSHTITAVATATRSTEVGFQVGTATAPANVSTAIALSGANAVQTGLLGTTVNLSTSAYQGLIGTDINGFDFLNALATQAGITGTYATLLSSSVTLHQVLVAAKAVLSETGGITNTGGNAADALSGLATLDAAISGSPTLTLAGLIDPGLLENQGIGSVNPATVIAAGFNVYGLATRAAEAAFGTGVITLPTSGLGIAGAASVSSAVAVSGAATAPSFALAPPGTLLNPPQIRLRMVINYFSVLTTLLGVPLTSVTITIPLVINIASSTVPGTAQSTAVTCGLNPQTDATAAISATSPAAQAYIGTVTNAVLDNLAVTLVVQPAPIATTSVLGIATFAVSGSSEQSVTTGAATSLTFTQAQMTAGTTQTVNSTGAAISLLANLGANLTTTTTFSLGLLGTAILNLDAPLVGSAVVALLTPAFLVGVDPLVDGVLAGLGVKLGYMDVNATGVRCAVPSLVL